MFDLIEAVTGLVMFVVTTLIRFPIIIAPIVAGIIAFTIGGVAGWLLFVFASLGATAVLKYFMRGDIATRMTAWGLLHLLPMVACRTQLDLINHPNLGLPIQTAWFLGFLLVIWKVPSRPQSEPPAPPEAQR